ncbi:MAG: ABC transporter ATP-binding protein [Christensenellales bacterium]
MLDIRDLTKVYPGGKRAVDGLSLSIEPGDIYGFIGKNGAGKTTTLRAIAGILKPTAGEILIGGVSLAQEPLLCKQRIAYIPDNPDLYEFLTGRQYLYFIADLFRLESSQREERIGRLAEQLDLAAQLDLLIGAYSHGMKQKLAMMGGFIHQPLLYLMDEPFVGLDPEAVVVVRQIIRDFCAGGSAVFFSTHILEVAQKLCNKVAVIKEGRLVAAGDTAALRGDSSLEDFFLETVRDEARGDA